MIMFYSSSNKLRTPSGSVGPTAFCVCRSAVWLDDRRSLYLVWTDRTVTDWFDIIETPILPNATFSKEKYFLLNIFLFL